MCSSQIPTTLVIDQILKESGLVSSRSLMQITPGAMRPFSFLVSHCPGVALAFSGLGPKDLEIELEFCITCVCVCVCFPKAKQLWAQKMSPLPVSE